jgi:hypothetical protein
MRTSTPALVNPAVLTWARQESGYPPEPVAKRLNVNKKGSALDAGHFRSDRVGLAILQFCSTLLRIICAEMTHINKGAAVLVVKIQENFGELDI